MAKIRIGTRASQLALWQAEWVAAQLSQRGHEVELVKIATRGDVSRESLSTVGGQGLFTKEIQRELLAERVDLAVHSLKDLPTVPIEGLRLAAVPERETTADCLLSRDGLGFEQLAAGARIGTGSSRRGAQLLAWRSDVTIADIRGNVDSRIGKMEAGEYDAIILAEAGLKRLNLLDRVAEILPQERLLPAVGQGALGLECRQLDTATQQALSDLNHPPSLAAVMAERALLASLLAGCLAPVAALAQERDSQLYLRARVFSVDGRETIEQAMSAPIQAAEQLGAELAGQLLESGAAELIAAARR